MDLIYCLRTTSIHREVAGINREREVICVAQYIARIVRRGTEAALLVIRGLVVPRQIAARGTANQALAPRGMEHGLSTLLQLFHVLPPQHCEAWHVEVK